jgi:hypothetical protein
MKSSAITISIGASFRVGIGTITMTVGIVGFTPISPAFYNHVADIVFVRSKPQMRRIAAGRVIAGMADQHTIWDVAV